MSLSRDEFQQICQTISGHRSSLTKARLYSAICCAGKSVIRSHLDNLWPTGQDEVDLEHAFRIFDQLEDLVVDDDDMVKIRAHGCSLEVEQLLKLVPREKYNDVRSCISSFSEGGMLFLEQFIRSVEETKHETLSRMLQLQQNRADSGKRHGGVASTSGHQVDQVDGQYTMSPTNSGHVFRGVLFTSPLRVVKHILAGEGTCRIRLKLINNCDMQPKMFANDVFAVVADSNGRVVAVTSQMERDGFETEEFQLGSGCFVTVMALRTTAPSFTKRQRRTDLTSDGKLSKRFKMTLMNVFDMFDFDCDGLLSRSEYDAFAIATDDNPPDDEEWELLTSQFDARAGCLTVAGFLFMHECEAFSGDDLAIPDIWESLYRLGYDDGLQLHHACPFMIEVENDGEVADAARLCAVPRSERDQILRGLYYRGKPEAGSELNAHIFTADYFGMMIVHNTNKGVEKTYRIEIVKEENVKWNFYHGKDDINPTSSGDWMLICSYSSTAFEHSAEFHLVEEPART